MRRSLRTCDRGFTLLELLVASTIGIIILTLAMGGLLANREVYHYDMIRTRLNENLRGALDFVAANAREAGEALPASFAAVQVINGGGGASDELILRRNLLDEVLKVCTAITSGTGVTQIVFADNSATAGCSYSGNTFNYDTWQTYRNDNGPTVKAFIYDSVTKNGEFFDYTSETDGGTSYSITRTPGTWTYSYPVGSSSVYMLEEWHFRVDDVALGDDLFQVIADDDIANPMNILSAVINFQVQVHLNDNVTVLSSFDPAVNNWTDIKAIEVTLSGEDTTLRGEVIDNTVSSRFFPRNVLSN